MKKNGIILTGVLSLMFISDLSRAQNIITVAGNGGAGYNGDGIQATAASLYSTGGNVIFDRSGSIIFCDRDNERVRKVNSSGIITTIAGNGVAGYSGDGGQATNAELNGCTYVCTDSSHNMYIADFGNNCIRRINPAGIISTFAGNTASGYTGNGGQATASELDFPCAVIADDTGNIYVADSYNNVVRKVNTSGVITVFAGTGVANYGGDGGQATLAQLNKPFRIGFDNLWNMYIADSFNSSIRKVNTSGIISTIAGNGLAGFSGDGGPATAAEMNSPDGMCVDAFGNIFIADTYNNRIRFVNTSGIITTVAGNGVGAFSGDGGPAVAAEVYEPTGTSLSYSNILYIDDYANNRIRSFSVVRNLEGINELSNNEDMDVYPNPSTGIFNVEIQSGKSRAKKIEIFSVLGEQIMNQNLTQNHSLIDLNKQSAGIYFYRVLAEDGNMVGHGKLIIQK